MRLKRINQRHVARALGAAQVVKLGVGRDWPLGWIGLASIVRERFVSRGGRPSDPHWDTKRLVPFRHETWERLSEKAKEISTHGRKVGPAQLAAILIEEQLAAEPARQRPAP